MIEHVLTVMARTTITFALLVIIVIHRTVRTDEGVPVPERVGFRFGIDRSSNAWRGFARMHRLQGYSEDHVI